MCCIYQTKKNRPYTKNGACLPQFRSTSSSIVVPRKCHLHAFSKSLLAAKPIRIAGISVPGSSPGFGQNVPPKYDVSRESGKVVLWPSASNDVGLACFSPARKDCTNDAEWMERFPYQLGIPRCVSRSRVYSIVPFSTA